MTVALQQVGPLDGAANLAGTAVAALRGVRLPNGLLADVLLDGGLVAAAPGDGVQLDAQRLACAARRLRAARPPRQGPHRVRLPPGVGNDLVAACDSWRVLLPAIDRADTEARALAAIRRYVARGITAIRTHVDLHVGPDPFRAVDALTGLRERLAAASRCRSASSRATQTPTELVAAAADRGIDVMGGCPTSPTTRGPSAPACSTSPRPAICRSTCTSTR